MQTPPSTFDSRLREALSDDATTAGDGAGSAGSSGGSSAGSSPEPSVGDAPRRPRPRRPRATTSFPVTVTQLPTVRCQVCGQTVPHRKGEVSAVLTAHYEREHPDQLG